MKQFLQGVIQGVLIALMLWGVLIFMIAAVVAFK